MWFIVVKLFHGHSHIDDKECDYEFERISCIKEIQGIKVGADKEDLSLHPQFIINVD